MVGRCNNMASRHRKHASLRARCFGPLWKFLFHSTVFRVGRTFFLREFFQTAQLRGRKFDVGSFLSHDFSGFFSASSASRLDQVGRDKQRASPVTERAVNVNRAVFGAICEEPGAFTQLLKCG